MTLDYSIDVHNDHHATAMRRFHVLDLTTEPPTRETFVVRDADASLHEAALRWRGPLVSWWSEAFWPTPPVQSPFTRRALRGELPAKGLR